MRSECIADCRLADTGFNYTMSLIQGKYKMVILYTLMEFRIVRFNEMQKYIGSITYKTLSSALKQLGGGWACAPKGIPADPAKGGIQPDREGPIPHPHLGPDV